jgi:hypothetical protein
MMIMIKPPQRHTCGKKPTISEHEETDDQYGFWAVTCDECYPDIDSSATGDTELEAIYRWNKRFKGKPA